MKINVRILLINFAIVGILLLSSGYAFYSIMYNVLSSQQSKMLLNSGKDFIYTLQTSVENIDNNFNTWYLNTKGTSYKEQELQLIDFIITIKDDSLIKSGDYYASKNISLNSVNFYLSQFFTQNPYLISRRFITDDGIIYYYGNVITQRFLNNIANIIKADILISFEGVPSLVSNESNNQELLLKLKDAYSILSGKNNFDIISEEGDKKDFFATIYKPRELISENSFIDFVVFTTLTESAELRSSLKYILGLIAFAGIIISLILSYLFTGNIRKKIGELSSATEITKKGDFSKRINVQGKDELAELAIAFNIMLEELKKIERSREDYSEFITLLNQSPTLSEVADSALKKIIVSGNFTVGALYQYENNNYTLISCYGVAKDKIKEINRFDVYETAVQKREIIEISIKENFPKIYSGITEFSIRNFLIIPIIYDNDIIAIVELGSIDKITLESKNYLIKIREQLAIGLMNAASVVKLEKLISELTTLNENYSKQNEFIIKQNEELKKLHHSLEEKAEELAIQKEKAEEATRLKSQFLASMSHELRTPMNSILGLTELILEDKKLAGKNRERLTVVLKSGRRLMNLINDILDLSKIEAGKMELRLETFFINDLIREIEDYINPLIINKKLQFTVEKEFIKNLQVSTDKGKATQVLINLLGNAVKFTDKGEIKFVIGTTKNDELLFKISDTGIGIEKKDLPLIFEEFRQVDGSTTRKYSGTGLGLSICKKIADFLKGRITVESKIGFGSTFSFVIPVSILNEINTEKIIKFDPVTLRKNKMHPILVIDDDPEVRYTIGQYLNSRGYDVIFADNGELGVKMAIEQQPFAITLDVMLPQKDGWTVLKELKENETTKDIPVIMISILGEKNIGYGLGAFEYFIKPISAEKLFTALNKLENIVKKKIEKIVLVDDDENEFERYKREFGNDDVKIEFIQDSQLAFNIISQSQPDLIIIDLMMPNIDGISLSYKLKSSNLTRNIPIIISTAKNLSSEEKDSLYNIVEDITIKSNGHPLDVLRIVRDTISFQEKFSNTNETTTQETDIVEDTNSDEENVEQLIENNSKFSKRAEVLIVDDDEDTLFTINEIVQSMNCSTKLAHNGIECLEVLKEKKPDIILLDIMMPGMDGFQTIKKIKENDDWKDIPVFAVTAKAMVDDKSIILKNGFSDYVPKPVNASMLAFKIEKELVKINE